MNYYSASIHVETGRPYRYTEQGSAYLRRQDDGQFFWEKVPIPYPETVRSIEIEELPDAIKAFMMDYPEITPTPEEIEQIISSPTIK